MLLNGMSRIRRQYPGVVYLNSLDRTDRDQAVFGQIAFDLTDQLELSLGARYFEPEVHVKGFFGFGIGFTEAGWSRPQGPAKTRSATSSASGEADRKDAPCVNVDKTIEESDSVYRVNVSWKAMDGTLLYATWSEGYRPGGINRNPFAGDYEPDILTNYEIGWKTRFLDDRLQLNGAVFLEEWDDIQVSFQGANGITQVANGPQAEVQGIGSAARLAADRQPPPSIGAGVLRQRAEGRLLRHGLGRLRQRRRHSRMRIRRDTGLPNIKAPEGTALPITAGLQGQPDRALFLPGRRLRCVHAGNVRLPVEHGLAAGTRGQRGVR